MLKKIKRTAVALALATGTLAATAATAQAGEVGARQGDYAGCKVGYVCMYQNEADWNAGKPSHRWYEYGAHNLNNQYGTKWVFNNQHSGAKARLCFGYNGANCTGLIINSYTVGVADITPINSIKLYA
ncbi:hypothetical protein ACM01_20410 [Streptomyces viridochromogenes]|uniref:Peptidase inhibitor n=2 Tax=Streptomyces viridochromogenes TaxID=1938 RepID=A0A0J7ZCJ5_STRVR|nr:hypothetical protein ACM01_20410 [Streptomyces viridochromogenes]KOG11883.1 hypothetical protein ADK36_36190 [Streptomyces viridochromogenes]KOG24072.1 hypothetical protein ADK35_11870 [Streptomyces viridochromogenes]